MWYTKSTRTLTTKFMNVIIYTKNFEPITVLDLPLDLIESAERDGVIGIKLKPALNSVVSQTKDVIKVECFKLKWFDGTLKTILVSAQEDLVLALNPCWLPGQNAVVGAYKRTLKILTEKIQNIKPDN